MAVCPNCGVENPEGFQFCGACGATLAARVTPAHGARKTVTIVFSDLVGSTALGERLDPESLRDAMDRYFTSMRSVLEDHGGIVEKFIGDAVMAIFGLPHSHEDDPLRAARAALEMKEELAGLNNELARRWRITLATRTGISTGEVVVGDPASGQRLATGDAIIVAARLESPLIQRVHATAPNVLVRTTSDRSSCRARAKPAPGEVCRPALCSGAAGN